MFYLQKESEFTEEYKDAAFIIGSPDFFGARTKDDDKINVLIMCIAYKDIETGYMEKNKKIVVRMKIYEKELDYYKNILKRESIVKLKVRAEKEAGDEVIEFLLADIIDNNYKDDEDLNIILREYLIPIYYNDKLLGDFLYNRMIGSFDKYLEWIDNREVLAAFDDADENSKNKAAMFLRDVFINREEFDIKVKDYCYIKIIKDSNVIKKEIFMEKIYLLEIIVHEKDNYVNYRLGNKNVFNMDIIAEGDINGNLFNAFISNF